jgi:hypothetical protein
MGQPGRFHSLSSSAEYIGRKKQTEGSETSQYLQEKKSKEIPLVVASERGSSLNRISVSPLALDVRGCGAEFRSVADGRRSYKYCR